MTEPALVSHSPQSVRATCMGAAVEAQRMGEPLAEAQHLLLAMAAEQRSPAGILLTSVGLDHRGVLTALQNERIHSLRVAGFDPSASLHLAPTRLPVGRPRWGASIREAFDLSAAAARALGRRGSDFRQTDLLLGILALQVGTVPRALALAGIDVSALREAASGTA